MNEIIKIKISEIDDFKNHPYKVELGDELNDLVESIWNIRVRRNRCNY